MSKSIIKSGLVYLLIGFLPLASNFIIAPIFTRYLSQEEYGILAIAAVAQAYVSIFMEVGLVGAFSRIYFTYYTKTKLSDGLYSSVVIVVLCIALLIGVILYFNGNSIFQLVFSSGDLFSFELYGWIIWSSALLIIIQTLTLSLYRNNENIRAYMFVAIASFLSMSMGSILGVVVFDLGAYGSLLGKLWGAAFIILPYTLYYFYKHPPIVKLKFLKPVFKYALPLVPYAIVGLVMDNMDKQFGEYYLGLSKLGLYNVAFLIASVPSILLFASQSTINPQVFKLLEAYKITRDKKNLQEVSNLFEAFLIFMLLVIAGVVAVIAPLTHFYLGPNYQEIVYYVPLITLAFVPRSLYVVYIIPILFDNKTKYLPLINSITVLFGAVLGIWLVPHYGLVGLCVLFVLVKLIQLLTAMLIVKSFAWFTSGILNLNKSIVLYMLVSGLVVISQMRLVFNEYIYIVNLAPLLVLIIIILFFYKKQYMLIYERAILYFK